MIDRPYHDGYETESKKIGWYVVEPAHAILQNRRKQLNLTQKQVAEKAGINIRQYQKFESGEQKFQNTSMKIGLAVCKVLELDPYRFLNDF